MLFKQCCTSDKKELANDLGKLLKDNNLSKEICEFLKYKFMNFLTSNNFDTIYETFQIMLQDGMTYYINKRCKNIIQCEMKIFANMLEIIHFWGKNSLKFDDSIFNYLRYDTDIELNLSRIDFSNKVLARLNLRGADFNNANLAGVDLSDANLIDANFDDIILTNSNLENTIISKDRADYFEKNCDLKSIRVYCSENNTILDYIH